MNYVLHVVGFLGRGGDTSVILNVMQGMNPEQFHFDFVTHKGADEGLIDRLRAEGSRVYVLEGDVRKLGPVKYYQAILRVIRQAPCTYDIIHVHTAMQSGISLMAAKHAGIPVRICHSHVTSIQRKTSRLSRLVFSPFLRFLYLQYATSYAACSKEAAGFLFGSKRSCAIIYNGISLERYLAVTPEQIQETRNSLRVKKDELLIGHVARFSAMKNQKYILSLARALKDRPDIRIVLVGSGKDFPEIQKEAADLGDKIIFTGQRSDIPALMHCFDAFLLPSLPGEGFPVTIMEAQAAGCPCFISENVTSEVEVGLHMVSRIALSDTARWISALRTLQPSRDYKARKQLCLQLKALGFGTEEFISNWLALYTSD